MIPAIKRSTRGKGKRKRERGKCCVCNFRVPNCEVNQKSTTGDGLEEAWGMLINGDMETLDLPVIYGILKKNHLQKNSPDMFYID